MGKENGNTTNSWLNLAKVLEITINDGRSLLSGQPIGLSWRDLGYDGVDAVLESLEAAFMRQLDHILEAMRRAANDCVSALGMVGAPLSSALHGCLASGRDMRDPVNPGTKYGGSGCLAHGLSVLADSLRAVSAMRGSGVASGTELLAALRSNFEGSDRLRGFLLAQDKYGNNIAEVDALAARLAGAVCSKVSSLHNLAGNAFAPDFSTPSTHLLYGYQTGATPDGRKAREMLGYGIDPRPGAAVRGFQERLLSSKRMPFNRMSGGYASHIGLSPEDFAKQDDKECKAAAMRRRVVEPLFAFNRKGAARADDPYYVYFNVDDASHLRKVLDNPKKYAPNGIYIMRIHGTFVNFLDLSPAIQRDIIERLDPVSTRI